jgi:hypothetical protein
MRAIKGVGIGIDPFGEKLTNLFSPNADKVEERETWFGRIGG